jgi:hypothetical protein
MQEVAPFVSPNSVATEGSAAPSRKRVKPKRPRAPVVWLLWSVAVFGATLLAEIVVDGANAMPPAVTKSIAIVGFGASVLLALYSLVRAVVLVFRAPTPGGVLGNLIVTLASLFMAGLGAIGGLVATFGFSRGRQLRRHGRVLLPKVCAGEAWASSGLVVAGASLAPGGLAEQWRENGRTEHASVASFARLTLDLLALGAPPALVSAANQDALDEIRHAEACFALAYALDGKFESPGPFPEAQRAHTLPRGRSFALATLAVTSLVDGALHEGVSARIIAKLARRSDNPSIAGVLRGIAADEGRHAAHGWDVVEWCLDQGGVLVAQALAGALRVLPAQMRSNLPAPARAGAWECWGIHGEALETAEYEATRAHVILRARALIARTAHTKSRERANQAAY